MHNGVRNRCAGHKRARSPCAQFGDGDKQTVSQWLAAQNKDLKIADFKRFTLVAE